MNIKERDSGLLEVSFNDQKDPEPELEPEPEIDKNQMHVFKDELNEDVVVRKNFRKEEYLYHYQDHDIDNFLQDVREILESDFEVEYYGPDKDDPEEAFWMESQGGSYHQSYDRDGLVRGLCSMFVRLFYKCNFGYVLDEHEQKFREFWNDNIEKIERLRAELKEENYEVKY